MMIPVIAAVFLVCLPFFLLPTWFAFHADRRWRWVILPANLLLIGGLAFQALGVVVALILWLVLLHFSLKKDRPTDDRLDEEVSLAPYDPQWPEDFVRERARISATFALPDDAIEHIGSTAVPGLIAKPVVDMMLGVSGLPPSHDLVSRLEILGYENLGEAGVPGRVYLRLREARSFNLQVVERGGAHWTANLALRDLLRRDPAARERYAEAKRAALASGRTRLVGYSAAKGAAVAELLDLAKKA